MTTESLVPQGLPQGGRQQQVENMREAGLPLEPPPLGTGATSVPAGSPNGQPGAPVRSGTDLLADTTPDDFPFLANDAAAPDPEAAQPGSVLAALEASAQSSFGRAVLARLQASGG